MLGDVLLLSVVLVAVLVQDAGFVEIGFRVIPGVGGHCGPIQLRRHLLGAIHALNARDAVFESLGVELLHMPKPWNSRFSPSK